MLQVSIREKEINEAGLGVGDDQLMFAKQASFSDVCRAEPSSLGRIICSRLRSITFSVTQ